MATKKNVTAFTIHVRDNVVNKIVLPSQYLELFLVFSKAYLRVLGNLHSLLILLNDFLKVLICVLSFFLLSHDNYKSAFFFELTSSVQNIIMIGMGKKCFEEIASTGVE